MSGPFASTQQSMMKLPHRQSACAHVVAYHAPANTVFHVTQAVLDTIRADGFHIGETGGFAREDGEWQEILNAVDAKTGESFTVAAPDKYMAIVELAWQVGVELKDE